MIEIISAKTKEQVGSLAADVITNQLKCKADSTFGFATGSSPVGMYTELIRRCKNGEISFKNVRCVNLDEYVGLDAEHDQSYAYFMRKNLFDGIDIDLKNTNLPNGLATDLAAECERYDAVVDSMGGVDIQVLGIGNNGHIGFNEPSDIFTYGTNVVELTESTIDANSRFFESRELVPTKAISMGVGQIMAARKILLIALGEGKAYILEKALFGEVTPRVPASILRFAKDVTVVADEAALSVIRAKHPEALA